MSETPFARVLAAVATPFRANLGVDHERLIAHARWLLDNGCDGLLLFGTTGEAASLSVPERKRALEAILAAGLPANKIMVGTGCCAVADTVDLTLDVHAAGCAGVLIVPPFYYKGVSDGGVVRFYDEIVSACASALPPVYLYNIPQVSGVGVSPDVAATLLERYGGRIRGYKDSSGQWSNTATLLSRFPSLHVYVGSENLLLENLRCGGAGCISAGINVQPSFVRRVLELARGEAADEALGAANAVRQALEKRGPLVPAVKAALAKIHGQEEWALVRPPLDILPQPARDALISELRALSVAGI